MDLKKFAHDMMGFAKGAAIKFTQNNDDFIPTFVVLKDGGIGPVPFPYYTRDREFHIAMMKSILESSEADAFALVMEAWISSPKINKDKKIIDPADYPRPSLDPERKECLIVHAGSRDGGEVVLMMEIKRHGHKLTFDKIVDTTDGATGKSAVCLTSNLFKTETIN